MQPSDASSSRHKLPFSALRILLALYFFVYAYVVATGMVPLPDQPPRIDFFAVFCLTLGVVIGFYSLIGSYRLFLIGTWFFVPMAMTQMDGKLRFLEMMLEPLVVQKMTAYSLYGVFLVLLSPPALRTYSKPISERTQPHNLLGQKGLPY